ncbi:hypothetical protein EBR21_05970, partial [bacterium]|nr:hypothetical protein [bacterium]
KGYQLPVIYLAIAPENFEKICQGLAAVGITKRARVVVENPTTVGGLQIRNHKQFRVRVRACGWLVGNCQGRLCKTKCKSLHSLWSTRNGHSGR